MRSYFFWDLHTSGSALRPGRRAELNRRAAGWRAVLSLMLTPMLAARGTAGTAPSPPGFSPSAWFGEQIREFRPIPQTRAVLLAPGSPLPGRPNRLIVYFTPNGNTVEQTLGCRPGPGLDWRFDIQHVAAQVRRWRELDRRKNLYLACVEAEGLSWPAWRQAHSNAPDLAQTLLARL
ncbi:MAG: hypothetical protein FJX77_07200, partial [Armatimonadetes bacterium]|nr:hypothetical protein [Armatimonadota bacterium]